MDVYEFTLIYTLTSITTGLIIYFVFYWMFQKYVASKTPVERDEVSSLIVMGGFIVEEPARIPVTKVFKDIYKRALGRLMLVEEWTSRTSTWYLIGLVVLALIVIIALVSGW